MQRFEDLRPFCASPRQHEILDAVIAWDGDYAKASNAVGVTTKSHAVSKVIRRIKKKAGAHWWGSGVTEGETLEVKGTGSESQTLDMQSEKRVVTVADAIAKGGIDLQEWEVERFVLNSWEVGAKGPDKRVRVTPIWQVKIWLKKKQGWSAQEFRNLLIDDLKKQAPAKYSIPASALQPSRNLPLLGELSIFDAHFGKLAWSPETGQDYDLKICRTRYLAAGRDLIRRMVEQKIERMLFVVGNDFFHADHNGGTTAGTQVDCDGRWQKSFRIGKECCITLAEEAATYCPVDIMIVQGNHDRDKVFCLGEVLAARFCNHIAVNVINDPDVYSYYAWGKVLLGFVHGQNHASKAKRAELPIQMSTDRPEDWAKSVWREIHLGHFHSEQEDVWKYRKVEHVRDVAVRVLPSLSSTDAWHREVGYASVLAAEAYLYHKEKGRYSILSYCAEG